MRQLLALIIGVAAGILGAVLFMQSQPPDSGSEKKRILVLERELRQTQRKVRLLEGSGKRAPNKRTVSDEVRTIVEDIREGREVSLDDVFTTMKPWMRNLAPLFDRIRIRDQKRHFDRLAGELATEYGLSKRDKKRLRNWFESKAEENARRYQAVLESDTSGMVDLIRASRDWSEDTSGLDKLMNNMLKGEDLERYQEKRLTERVEKVEQESHRKFQNLDRIVELDEDQNKQVFDLLVRGSKNYDPSVEFDGMGDDRSVLSSRERDEAIRSLLRPEQVEAFDAHRKARFEEATRDMTDLGLTLPKNWDLLEEDDW